MPVSAPDWLGSGVVACLEKKCGTLDDAVLVTYEATGGEFGALHALGVRDLSGFGASDVHVPESRARIVWTQVAEFHGCGAQETVEATAQQPASLLTRPSLPTGIADYAPGTLERAVKGFARDQTRGDVSRGGRKLPPPDARRVRLMFRVLGLLRLNEQGKLVVDERVARKGSRYVLRYVDETGTRWLDPNVELKGR
jgi:hypothetical protein